MSHIRELRTKNRMSQSQLAKVVNVHQTAVSQWENGLTNPDISSAKLLAEYFNVTTDYILGLTEVAAPPGTSRKTLSERLLLLRNKKGVSTFTVSETLRIKHSEYTDFEKGVKEPTIDIVNRLANYYNVTPDYISGDEETNGAYTRENVTDEEAARIGSIYKCLSKTGRKKLLFYSEKLFHDEFVEFGFEKLFNDFLENRRTLADIDKIIKQAKET